MDKYSIIIVENDEDEQYFMKQGFDKAGLFDVMAQVPNGDALFDWLQDHPDNLPDIILTDLNMPGKNGNDIITGITTNPGYQHIPVVITSTSSTPSIRDKCLSRGAADYMVKPDTFVDYVPFVNELHMKLREKNILKGL